MAANSRPLPTATALPSPTPVANLPTIEPPESASDQPTLAKATVNLNIRNGPGTEYEVIGLLAPNEQAEIVGRSSDEQWLQIQYPADSSDSGWIAAEFVTVIEPELEVAPATDTETPQTSSTQIPAQDDFVPGGGAVPIFDTAGCRLALETLRTASSTLCRFSADGQRIAAPAADGSLWVVGTDGQSFRQFGNDRDRFLVAGDLLWSPNGQYVAFRSTGLDGLGSGVGYYHLASGQRAYLGPDAQTGGQARAEKPRWTEDGRLVLTWYQNGANQPPVIAVLDPSAGTESAPTLLDAGAELSLSAGYQGQQIYPWAAGRVWYVGDAPAYEVDIP